MIISQENYIILNIKITLLSNETSIKTNIIFYRRDVNE